MYKPVRCVLMLNQIGRTICFLEEYGCHRKFLKTYIYIYIYMNTFILYLNIEEQDGSASFSYVIFSETL